MQTAHRFESVRFEHYIAKQMSILEYVGCEKEGEK